MNGILPAGIEAYLSEAGFTATEILVLKKLVEEESLTVRELASKTGKSTGVLDQSMKKLLQKGIAQKGTINGQPRYSIRKLDNLIEWVKQDMQERQKTLARKHENFEQYISSLTIDRSRPDIEHFTGEEGIAQAYNKILETGEEFLTMTPVKMKAEDDPLRSLRVELFRKRQVRKIFQRIIAPDTILARRFQSRDNFEYRKTVLFPAADFSLEFERTIAGNMLLCINHTQMTACLLKYPELVNVERSAFDALWVKQVSSDSSVIPHLEEQALVPLKTRFFSSVREFVLSKRAIVLLGIFAVASCVLTSGLYMAHRQINLDHMRSTVMTIASLGSKQFDAEDIIGVQDVADIHTPQYAKLVATLNRIRRSNPDITYAYLMRKTDDPQILSFVADADSLRPIDQKDLNRDGTLSQEDALSYPGDSYDISGFIDITKAFNEPYADADVTSDQWGSFITGAAPVRDSSGETVAIVGVDMLSTSLDEVNFQTFFPLYVFVALFFLFGLFRYCAINRSILRDFWLATKEKKRIVFLSIIFILVLVSAIIYFSRMYVQSLLIEQTGQRLMAIAVTAAADFDPADLDQLHFARDMRTEAYQRVFRKLNDIRNKNPEVTYVYIVRKLQEPNLFEFVADADSNYNLPEFIKIDIQDEPNKFGESDENVWPGYVYDDSVSLLFTKALQHPSYVAPTVDQWGPFMSGCSPIKKISKSVLLLCLDKQIK